MAFSLNASSFTSGSNSGIIGCSISSGNNTPSVTIVANTQINPYPSTGIGYSSICFWMSFNTNNVIPIYGSYNPGGGSIVITASQLNSIGARFFIGQPLLILFYSSQTYTNNNVINGSLPLEFFIPTPPGRSNNIYGGIQTSISFVVQPCGIPTGLVATSYQNSQVPLTWSAPVDNGGSGITSYLIQYSSSSSSGPWSSPFNTGSSSTSYIVPNLTNGTQYYFQVAAVNGYCNTQFIVAVGQGPNKIAYSYDGINWTGLGNIIFDILFTQKSPIMFGLLCILLMQFV